MIPCPFWREILFSGVDVTRASLISAVFQSGWGIDRLRRKRTVGYRLLETLLKILERIKSGESMGNNGNAYNWLSIFAIYQRIVKSLIEILKNNTSSWKFLAFFFKWKGEAITDEIHGVFFLWVPCMTDKHETFSSVAYHIRYRSPCAGKGGRPQKPLRSCRSRTGTGVGYLTKRINTFLRFIISANCLKT